MHELYPDIRITGEILLNGKNILKTNPMEVRRMAGHGLSKAQSISDHEHI